MTINYIVNSKQSNLFKRLLVIGANTSLFLATVALSIASTASQSYAQAINSPAAEDNLLDRINRYAVPENDGALGQVTNINQLRDVSPTDWSYEALRSLVDRYGCISGFPNQTYRGNQPLSRYEFAAGLNSCLNQIERLIASSESVSTDDLATIQQLAQEFEAELATLGGRVDSIESQVAILEDNQFSTTTKLSGEAVFSVADAFIGENVATGEDLDTETVLGNRVRLGFNTSFTGKDLLFTQLTSGNFPFFSGETGTFEGDLGLLADNGNNVDLLVALYSFPLSDRTTVVLEGYGGVAFDFADTISPLDHFNDSASGAISYFGVRNPIYNQVLGSGIGIRSELSDSFELSAGYLAPSGTAANPNQENGLFSGEYSALGQIVFKPGDRFKLGLTYINSYNSSDTFAGSNLANINSFIAGQIGESVPITSNSYGVQTSFNLSDSFVISGWAGYTTSRVLESAQGEDGSTLVSRGDQDVWNWAVTLSFPDLFKEGNLAGLIFGMEPKVTDSTIDIAGVAENTDPDTSFHVEAFYQYQLTDNIAVTPGAVWITAPDHDEENADTVIGTLRTTFTF
ncbi:MAG: iron uptake porin [Cyanobacteria bacterium P01_G01_bin.19]